MNLGSAYGVLLAWIWACSPVSQSPAGLRSPGAAQAALQVSSMLIKPYKRKAETCTCSSRHMTAATGLLYRVKCEHPLLLVWL